MAIGALQRLDMASHALQRADTLSGGQQQRVAIAKALVQEPEVVLADECIASLDPPNAAKVMSALKAINEEDGITIICNLHHLNTARTYCQRIIGMSNGRIVFDGPPESLTVSKLQVIYGTAEESEDLQTDTWIYSGRRTTSGYGNSSCFCLNPPAMTSVDRQILQRSPVSSESALVRPEKEFCIRRESMKIGKQVFISSVD